MTTTVRQLKNFTRNDQAHDAAYALTGALPPRETFARDAEVLEAYDALAHFREAVKAQDRLHAEKTAGAKAAATAYREAIGTALAEGTDTTAVVNDEPRLLAEAAAHVKAKAEARLAAEDAGRRLGALVQERGAAWFDTAEQNIAEASENAAKYLAALSDALEEWGTAYSVRHHLSRVVHAGGVGLYWQGPSLPSEVTQALATLTALRGDLDELKAEEKALAEWRTSQASAKSANARIIGRG